MLAEILRRYSVHAWFAVLLAACAGCGQSGSNSQIDILAPLDPQLIAHHGHLTFVNDIETGARLATEHNRPCLLFFTAEWCTYCHLMAETAFTEQAVGELGGNFVCIVIDADRRPDLCRHFEISGFPTIQFLSPQGTALHRLVGQQSPENLVAGMRAALDRFAWLDSSQLK